MPLGNGKVKIGVFSIWLLLFLITSFSANAKELYRLDFSQQKDGDATKWLQKKGLKFELDADEISLKFEDGKLKIKTTEEISGIIGIKFTDDKVLENIGFAIIEWGVEKFPQGADWEDGNNRLAIGFLFALGTEKLSSGLPFGINAAPYFLGPFIGEKEHLNKRYLGRLYKEGGRYYCVANKNSTGTVVTHFDINQTFQKEFNKPTPALSAFGFQMNTKDTEGAAEAFIKRVIFFSR